ncbi:nephrin-like [Saccoglossus kowalevskii]
MRCTENTAALDYSWFKNDQLLDQPDDNLIKTDNTLTFNVVTRNDRALYNCCLSIITETVCSDAKLLDVLYLPDYPWPECTVGVESEDYYEAGETIVITCHATDGNPEPVLTWFNGSDPMDTCVTESFGVPTVTNSTCSWVLESTDNGRKYICHGIHNATEVINSCNTGYLDVKYPPDYPTCNMSVESSALVEGNNTMITCESLDGNPAATLLWINTTDNTVLNAITLEPSDTESRAVYSWTLSRADNAAIYRCNATNLVQEEPLTCEIDTLNVTFSAEYVRISNPGTLLEEGDITYLTCETGSSNPISSVNWFRNNTLIEDSENERVVNVKHSSGDYNGFKTTEQLEICLTAKHNAAFFQCKACVDVVGDIVESNNINLNVSFPPVEPNGCKTCISGNDGPVIEGDILTLTCTTCSSNPASTITWYRNRSPTDEYVGAPEQSPGAYYGTVTSQKLRYNVTRMDHDDVFQCEAVYNNSSMNQYGSDHVIVDVHCE